MAVSNSYIYTRSKSVSFKSINEAQVCVGKSSFLTQKCPAISTKEIKDNNEREETLMEVDDQDTYVPRFSIQTIPTPVVGKYVNKDVKYEKIEPVNEAQVCVDDSFLSNSERLDSESTIIGSMKIDRFITSGKKCDGDKNNITDELKKSERYTISEGLTMKESMGRSNVISVMGSSFQSSSPHMKNFGRSASSRQKYQIHGKWTTLDTTFDTIRVRLKQPLTLVLDTLVNYFENKRKSGGGDIESLTIIKGTEMEVEEVLITFSESKDAMTCVQQQHMIEKNPLNVQKYDPNDPSQWEMDKVLVTGLNHVTTKDTLMNFLEPAAGVDLIELVRGVQRDAAIVVFAEKPDFAKISKRCKEKKLEGNTLFAQMVEKCRTIYVKGIDKSITYDLIETFFCNKVRSGGGDVEKVDYHPEDGYCIVYFENPSDAKNVAAKRKLTVIDKEIKAQMYFPCLGLPEQSINWKDMPYVSYKMNKYLIKFVKNHPAECRQIEEALQKKFVNVEWPESKSYLIVNLKCTVTKDVENAKEILKSWKEEAVAEMDSQMKKLVYQTRSILPEAWPLFLAQMKTVDIDDQDKVTVNSERKILTPVQQSPVQNADSDSEEEKPRRIRHKAYGLNYEIKVISGTLAKMRVDVIVNSTDKSLNLTLGATSKSLLRAGGESLQNECRMKYKYGVQPGKVAMTKGGNLHCRQVYHGAIQKWDHYKGDALSKFNEFVNNCLQMADKNLMSSIAFPAVGTGRLGYPRDLAARTMFKCCRDFLRQKCSTTLKKIIFVVYHEDKETFQTFQSILRSEEQKHQV